MEGSVVWFSILQGLNDYGHMTDVHASKKEVKEWFGMRLRRGEWRYTFRNQSPRMNHKITYLHQLVFQRTLHQKGYFPFGFARGILAEKHGYIVDWASYAEKMYHYGA
jgi:hypothetical protein